MTNKTADNGLGKLYLIPTLLGGDDISILPEDTIKTTLQLSHFLVENLRSARRFLVKIGIKKTGRTIDELAFELVNKKEQRSKSEMEALLLPALQGEDIGLLSEAGCPAVADPGAEIVKIAHEMGIVVIPLIGPSSILLALMASGMNGQSFSFHGYLPIEKLERDRAIKKYADFAVRNRQTQLFIETPYRSQALFEAMLKAVKPNLRLCVAVDLTLPTQEITTMKVSEWKVMAKSVDLHKRPAIFLIGK